MPNYGMKSGLADSVKATGKRELHEPWTPNFDFGVEERPIPPNSFDPQQEFYKTQEGISGLGDAYGDRAGYNAFALGRDTVNSNSDPVKQERIQQLYTRLDEVNARIQELKVEISYQEKLKALEMSGDPLWEMAKDKYIHTGDMSDLSSILQRVTNVSEAEAQRDFNANENKLNRDANYKLAKEAKDQTKAEQKEANARSARFSRNVLSELLKTYNAVKGDPSKQIEAGNDLIKQLQDVKEKAEIAGLTMEDLYSEMPEELEAVNLAINEARLAVQSGIEEGKQRAADAKIAQAERNAVSNAVAEFNKAAKDYKTATDQKKTFEKDHPGFIFSLVKGKSGGWTIDYKEKAK